MARMRIALIVGLRLEGIVRDVVVHSQRDDSPFEVAYIAAENEIGGCEVGLKIHEHHRGEFEQLLQRELESRAVETVWFLQGVHQPSIIFQKDWPSACFLLTSLALPGEVLRDGCVQMYRAGEPSALIAEGRYVRDAPRQGDPLLLNLLLYSLRLVASLCGHNGRPFDELHVGGQLIRLHADRYHLP